MRGDSDLARRPNGWRQHRSQLPEWAQRLALALPTTWAARGLEGVTWQGMGFAGAWPCALALVGYSVGFLAVAWWRIVRTEGGRECPA